MPGDSANLVVSRYAPDRYERVLAVMADAALLPRDHGAWHRGFEERLRVLARDAVNPLVVTLDPDDFLAWCVAEDLPCDATARLEYAEWLAARDALPQIAAAPAARPDDDRAPAARCLADRGESGFDRREQAA